MVSAINRLNGGRGFAVPAGRPDEPLYYRFDYSRWTYPFGTWATRGRTLSSSRFGSSACDLLVGMPNGCPDQEIMAQALVAGTFGKLYFTGRGPQSVLTRLADDQPYFFSVHVRSDTYANNLLKQMSFEGAESIALLYENYGNDFFYGLGQEARRYALSRGYTIASEVVLTRPGGSSSFDKARLNQSIDEAVAAHADVLLLVLRAPEFEAALARLRARRPHIGDGHASREGHVFRAIFWQGASWGANEDCAGLGAECGFVVGASQLGTAEAYYTVDALLGETYRWLGEYAGQKLDSFIPFPDGAAIVSTWAQALQTVFRFRVLADPSQPLADRDDYESLVAWLASGSTVAETFCAPLPRTRMCMCPPALLLPPRLPRALPPP